VLYNVEGVGRGLPGLYEVHAAIPAVMQGWDETASNGAYDSGDTHHDSGNMRYRVGNWRGWPSSSEALGSGG
jgi:hypothetical protein